MTKTEEIVAGVKSGKLTIDSNCRVFRKTNVGSKDGMVNPGDWVPTSKYRIDSIRRAANILHKESAYNPLW